MIYFENIVIARRFVPTDGLVEKQSPCFSWGLLRRFAPRNDTSLQTVTLPKGDTLNDFEITSRLLIGRRIT